MFEFRKMYLDNGEADGARTVGRACGEDTDLGYRRGVIFTQVELWSADFSREI